MSFNQLADELIAQMASYLNFADVFNLLQSQKRVNQILKRNKLDKPNIYKLEVNHKVNSDNPRIATVTEVKNGKRAKLLPEHIHNTVNYLIIDAICKFTSISILSICDNGFFPISLDEHFAQKLSKSGTKIRLIVFKTVHVLLSAKDFISFCNKFEEVHLRKIHRLSPANFFSDDVICQIVPSTKIKFHLYIGFGLNISDRSLEAIVAGRSDSVLDVPGCTTMFTVNGIRRYVEDTIHLENNFTIHLGVINVTEKENAEDWFDEAENTELPYKITISRGYDGRMKFEVLKEHGSISFQIANM